MRPDVGTCVPQSSGVAATLPVVRTPLAELTFRFSPVIVAVKIPARFSEPERPVMLIADHLRASPAAVASRLGCRETTSMAPLVIERPNAEFSCSGESAKRFRRAPVSWRLGTSTRLAGEQEVRAAAEDVGDVDAGEVALEAEGLGSAS